MGYEAKKWQEAAKGYRKMLGLVIERKIGAAKANVDAAKSRRLAAVIGSKEFVNEAFASAKERCSEKRKGGARTMRGNASEVKGVLYSMRDLKV